MALAFSLEGAKPLFTNKTSNLEFIKSLSSEQQMFFNSLGVDLSKVEVDKTIYEIPEDEKMPASKI